MALQSFDQAKIPPKKILDQEFASSKTLVNQQQIAELDDTLAQSELAQDHEQEAQALGLPEDAKFIVNTGADFRLEWRPYFDAFDDPLIVQYADLKVHGCYFLDFKFRMEGV